MSADEEYPWPWPIEPEPTLIEQIQERAQAIPIYSNRIGRPYVEVDGEEFTIEPGRIKLMIGSNYMSEDAVFSVDQGIDLVASLLVAIEHAKKLSNPE